MNQTFSLNVNGKLHAVEAAPDMPLLYALRNDIHFASESFMDEVAAALDMDAVEFRLRYVKEPRDLAVSGPQRNAPAGRRGLHHGATAAATS